MNITLLGTTDKPSVDSPGRDETRLVTVATQYNPLQSSTEVKDIYTLSQCSDQSPGWGSAVN